MVPSLMGLTNIFYGNQLTAGRGTSFADRPIAREIQNMIQRDFKIRNTSVVLMKVKRQQAEESTHSVYNMINATACFQLLERLLTIDALETKSIVIIAMYQAQVKAYRQALRAYIRQFPDLKIEDIRANTRDSYQGKEGRRGHLRPCGVQEDWLLALEESGQCCYLEGSRRNVHIR
ncbi:hypothetical protein MMC34_006240 [Xylographa carneopallida]|nr:hypothetical protein [Xylographa carneopallida]